MNKTKIYAPISFNLFTFFLLATICILFVLVFYILGSSKKQRSPQVVNIYPTPNLQTENDSQTTSQLTNPPTIYTDVDKSANKLNLTQDVPNDWIKEKVCGVVLVKSKLFEKSLGPYVYDQYCELGYNYKQLVGAIHPQTIDVQIIKNYDGTSRRQFYFTFMGIKEPFIDDGSHQLVKIEDIQAGNNTSLALRYKDTDSGDGGVGDYNVYLIALDLHTLVVVKSEHETDIEKIFLTGIYKIQ